MIETIVQKAKQIYQTSLYFGFPTENQQDDADEDEEPIKYNPYLIKSKSMKVVERYQYGENHHCKINCIKYFKNDEIIIAADHPTIKYYKVGKEDYKLHLVMKYRKHKQAVNYIEQEINDYFLSCSDDGTVIRWKVNPPTSTSTPSEFKFKLLSLFSVKCQVLRGHTARVTQVLTARRFIFSCSDDRTIRCYSSTDDDREPKSLKSITAKNINGNFVCMLDIEGVMLVTASTDNIMRFWDYKTLKNLPKKSVDNVECAGVNCMRLLSFSLNIGGKGKVTVYDLKTKQIVITNDIIGNNIVRGFGLIDLENLICVDSGYNIYCIYVDCKNNAQITFRKNMKEGNSSITGMGLNFKEYFFIIDDQSNIKEIGYSVDNWIDNDLLFVFDGITF